MNKITKKRGRAAAYFGLAGILALTLLTRPSSSDYEPSNLETIVNKEDVRVEPPNPQVTLNNFLHRNKSKEQAIFDSYLALNPQKNVLNTFENMHDRIKIYTDLFDELETKYDLPRGILAGLAMQESQGYPDKLAYNGDGGVGLFQIQPGVAADLNLKVYGDSRRVGADKAHGKDMRDLAARFDNNLVALSTLDERFNPYLSSKAAAMHLNNYKKTLERTGRFSPELLIDAYNKGVYSKHLNKKSLHVLRVTNYMQQYNGSAAFKHTDYLYK